MSIEVTYPLLVPPAAPGGTESETDVEEGIVPVPLSETFEHVEQGLARLLEQFKSKPRLERLLGIYLRQIQEVEAAFWDYLEGRHLDVAAGALLDGIGQIVGQKRGALSDAEYRVYIRARIKINLSDGQPEQLIEIARLILGQTFDFRFRESYPAGIHFVLNEPLVGLDLETPWSLLMQAKPAGVRLMLEYVLVEVTDAFTLSSSGTVETSSAQGLGDTTDGAVGGRLAGILG